MSFGQSPSNLNVTKYTGDQISDVPCVNNPRAPRTTDINYPLFTLWRNSNKLAVIPDAEGDMWYLAKFTPNGSNPPSAIWIKLASGLEPSDLLTLSDNAGNTVFPDGAGNIQLAAANGITTVAGSSLITIGEAPSPGVSNLGVTYSSSTFSVTAANGSALSTTNPGFVVLPSKVTPGTLIQYTIVQNQSFIDQSGSSQINGNSFGVTNTGNTYNLDMPFFLYAVSNSSAGTPETAIAFMISRVNGLTTSPIAAKIAKFTSAVASTQGSMFSLDSSITVADYASSACLSIGSFRMQMPALNNWLVQTLKVSDGIGQFNSSTLFGLPTGSFGAGTGSFFTPTSGDTPPQWTSQALTYFMTVDGFCKFNSAFAAVTVSGVGAHTLQLAMPFISAEGGTVGTGFFTDVGPNVCVTIPFFNPTFGFNTLAQNFAGNGESGLLANNNFTIVGNQNNSVAGTYKVSIS